MWAFQSNETLEVDVQIKGASKTLNQCHSARPGNLVGKSSLLNQIGANRPCHYLKCFAQYTGFACKKPAQRKRHAQHPLSNRLVWKYGIHQHCTWDVAVNRQAQKTQKWQLQYFLEIPKNGGINVARAKLLYQKPIILSRNLSDNTRRRIRPLIWHIW